MAKEEVVQEIKNRIVDCMSLIDAENVEGCVSRMLNTVRRLIIQNEINVTEYLCYLCNTLYNLTNKTTDKLDTKVQKLNNLLEYIETTAKYTDDTSFDSTEGLENYIDHIADVEGLDVMDRCYIFTRIVRDSRISCDAGQTIARGLFKSIKW